MYIADIRIVSAISAIYVYSYIRICIIICIADSLRCTAETNMIL